MDAVLRVCPALPGRNRWAKRFLVLDGPLLSWYKDEKVYQRGGAARNSLRINETTTVHDSDLRPLCLEVGGWLCRGAGCQGAVVCSRHAPEHACCWHACCLWRGPQVRTEGQNSFYMCAHKPEDKEAWIHGVRKVGGGACCCHHSRDAAARAGRASHHRCPPPCHPLAHCRRLSRACGCHRALTTCC